MTALVDRRKQRDHANGRSADDLNPFRRHYFRGFKMEEEIVDSADISESNT
jgi:hypothetical protein